MSRQYDYVVVGCGLHSAVFARCPANLEGQTLIACSASAAAVCAIQQQKYSQEVVR
jgi:UDP-galactopyranose mutase